MGEWICVYNDLHFFWCHPTEFRKTPESVGTVYSQQKESSHEYNEYSYHYIHNMGDAASDNDFEILDDDYVEVPTTKTSEVPLAYDDNQIEGMVSALLWANDYADAADQVTRSARTYRHLLTIDPVEQEFRSRVTSAPHVHPVAILTEEKGKGDDEEEEDDTGMKSALVFLDMIRDERDASVREGYTEANARLWKKWRDPVWRRSPVSSNTNTTRTPVDAALFFPSSKRRVLRYLQGDDMPPLSSGFLLSSRERDFLRSTDELEAFEPENYVVMLRGLRRGNVVDVFAPGASILSDLLLPKKQQQDDVKGKVVAQYASPDKPLAIETTGGKLYNVNLASAKAALETGVFVYPEGYTQARHGRGRSRAVPVLFAPFESEKEAEVSADSIVPGTLDRLVSAGSHMYESVVNMKQIGAILHEWPFTISLAEADILRSLVTRNVSSRSVVDSAEATEAAQAATAIKASTSADSDSDNDKKITTTSTFLDFDTVTLQDEIDEVFLNRPVVTFLARDDRRFLRLLERELNTLAIANDRDIEVEDVTKTKQKKRRLRQGGGGGGAVVVADDDDDDACGPCIENSNKKECTAYTTSEMMHMSFGIDEHGSSSNKKRVLVSAAEAGDSEFTAFLYSQNIIRPNGRFYVLDRVAKADLSCIRAAREAGRAELERQAADVVHAENGADLGAGAAHNRSDVQELTRRRNVQSPIWPVALMAKGSVVGGNDELASDHDRESHVKRMKVLEDMNGAFVQEGNDAFFYSSLGDARTDASTVNPLQDALRAMDDDNFDALDIVLSADDNGNVELGDGRVVTTPSTVMDLVTQTMGSLIDAPEWLKVHTRRLTAIVEIIAPPETMTREIERQMKALVEKEAEIKKKFKRSAQNYDDFRIKLVRRIKDHASAAYMMRARRATGALILEVAPGMVKVQNSVLEAAESLQNGDGDDVQRYVRHVLRDMSTSSSSSPDDFGVEAMRADRELVDGLLTPEVLSALRKDLGKSATATTVGIRGGFPDSAQQQQRQQQPWSGFLPVVGVSSTEKEMTQVGVLRRMAEIEAAFGRATTDRSDLEKRTRIPKNACCLDFVDPDYNLLRSVGVLNERTIPESVTTPGASPSGIVSLRSHGKTTDAVVRNTVLKGVEVLGEKTIDFHESTTQQREEVEADDDIDKPAYVRGVRRIVRENAGLTGDVWLRAVIDQPSKHKNKNKNKNVEVDLKSQSDVLLRRTLQLWRDGVAPPENADTIWGLLDSRDKTEDERTEALHNLVGYVQGTLRPLSVSLGRPSPSPSSSSSGVRSKVRNMIASAELVPDSPRFHELITNFTNEFRVLQVSMMTSPGGGGDDARQRDIFTLSSAIAAYLFVLTLHEMLQMSAELWINGSSTGEGGAKAERLTTLLVATLCDGLRERYLFSRTDPELSSRVMQQREANKTKKMEQTRALDEEDQAFLREYKKIRGKGEVERYMTHRIESSSSSSSVAAGAAAANENENENDPIGNYDDVTLGQDEETYSRGDEDE